MLSQPSGNGDWLDGAVTENVSAGGMYASVPPDRAVREGQGVQFLLALPASQVYGPMPGRLSGTGRVIRVVRDPGRLRVAIRFDKPLAFDV